MYPEQYSYTGNYIPNPYETHDYTMKYVLPNVIQTNRIYVNTSFVQPTAPGPPVVSKPTVLVNPNFNRHSRQVHVNPNFAKKKSEPVKTNMVFVNPNVFNKVAPIESIVPSNSATTTPGLRMNILENTTKINQFRPPEINKFKLMNKTQPITSKYSKINNSLSVPGIRPTNAKINFVTNTSTKINNNPIVNTKNKLIRVQQPQQSIKTGNSTRLTFIPSTSSSRSIVTNKKIVNVQKPKQIVSRHKLIRNNSPLKGHNLPYKGIVKTKYKLVRGGVTVQRSPRIKQQLRKMSISIIQHSPSVNRFKLDNRTRRQFSTIIRSRYKLTKKAYMMRLDPKNCIIKQTKFKLIRSTKAKAMKSNETVKKTSKINLVKKKKFIRRNLVKINKKKLQKNNIPCEIYNRKGICKGHASGKCLKKHDPNQIQICIWFLQGICRDEKCTLSHKASPEKMPTCKFFLEGICHKDNCPYLHVKLSKDAPVCRDFLNGYCAKALECDKRHQFLCPDFEKDGNCSKKLCRYPHGKAVRQYKDTLLNVIARNRKSKVQRKNEKDKVQKAEILNVTSAEKNDNETVDSKRYYERPSGAQSAEKTVLVNVEENEDVGSIFDRPKLGALPSFISL